MASSSSSSSSSFQLIINNAFLDAYKKRTKNDLLAHPLAANLQSCDTPSATLAVLQQQIQEYSARFLLGSDHLILTKPGI